MNTMTESEARILAQEMRAKGFVAIATRLAEYQIILWGSTTAPWFVWCVVANGTVIRSRGELED
jgi:hypothetical protein